MITSLTHPCNFDGILNEETEQARRLAQYFRGYGIGCVLDVGCGPGNYVAEMRKVGIQAHGVDIDPRCKDVPHCEVLDITAFDGIFSHFPAILSLEVGEHIPEHLSWRYIRFIAAHTPGMVVFSAAAPGQGGDGHINCQNKSYWAHRFERYGYEYDPMATHDIRNYMSQGYHLGWFTQNVMIFHRTHD